MSMRRSVVSQPTLIAPEDFAGAVEYYLTLQPRQLPSRYFYDALGSALFNAICELPWYRITRAERALLDTYGHAMLAHVAPLSRIVELGPGNGAKLMTLIEAGRRDSRRLGYMLALHLIDVSSKALDDASRALGILEDVDIVTHEATYEAGLVGAMSETHPSDRTLVLFLGSNIGNFDRPGADAFLRGMRAALRPGDGLLLGADLVKSERELIHAYDDPLGVTAAFNRNLLVRINRELGGEIDVDAFAHRALWNAAESRVEMHLVSQRRQRVRVASAGIDFHMEDGETIWTESSYKYQPNEIVSMLERAGFRAVEQWIADEGRFALTLLTAA
jgi:L-histidine Nalpha-methyltransferase